jgi:hypothetical protein
MTGGSVYLLPTHYWPSRRCKRDCFRSNVGPGPQLAWWRITEGELFNSSRSKPILQNCLVLHGVEFGDLAKAHYLRLTVGSSAKNSFNSSSDSARANRIPPVGGIEGPDSRKRPSAAAVSVRGSADLHLLAVKLTARDPNPSLGSTPKHARMSVRCSVELEREKLNRLRFRSHRQRLRWFCPRVTGRSPPAFGGGV